MKNATILLDIYSLVEVSHYQKDMQPTPWRKKGGEELLFLPISSIIFDTV